MKKLNAQYNKLSDMVENIKGIISDLEEKIGDIQDNAWNEDRDVTDRENEICVEHIENAMSYLEYYTD